MRKALETDLFKIIEIYNEAIATRLSTADIEPVNVQQKKAWFDKHTEVRPLTVFEEHNEIIAWTSLEDFYGRHAYNQTVEVSIYVHPEFQKKGFGTIFLNETIEQALKLGIKTLVGYVFSHNEASIKLFEKLGFEKWGELPRVAKMDGKKYNLSIYGKHKG